MEFETVKKKNEIIEWLKNYKDTTHCDGVVLGLSGGKDSTVVAMLAKKVWGADKVFGVIMPNGKQSDIVDALEVAEQLEIRDTVVNIGDTVTTLMRDITLFEGRNHLGGKDWFDNGVHISGKAETNIPPRIRMTVLYAIAQSLGYRVIGTSNASERYIGWTTKWGDSACDLNPIAHLTCSEVVEIGKILAAENGLDEKFVTKTPTDGLTGKSDEENFGFTYEDLDRFIKDGDCKSSEISKAIIDLHYGSEHKRRMPYTIKNW